MSSRQPSADPAGNFGIPGNLSVAGTLTLGGALATAGYLTPIDGVLQINAAGSSTRGGALIINCSDGTPSPVPHGSAIHLVGSNDDFPALYIDGYDHRSIINLRSACGTIQAPTANTLGWELCRISARGWSLYNATDGNFTGSTGAISFNAAEAFTATGQGTYMTIRTTAIGSIGDGSDTVPPERVRIQPSGGVSIGDLTFNATDPGLGCLKVKSQLISAVATGTAPLVVASTTRVTNLNAATAGVADATPANGLTGTTLAANVVTSSLTSLGTLATLAVSGSATVVQPVVGATSQPFFIAVKNVTLLTAGSPADIATFAIPAWCTRYRLGLVTDGSATVVETASGTTAAATVRIRTGASGTGTDLFGADANCGSATVGDVVRFGAGGLTGAYVGIATTLYINQTANSANAGTVSFYIRVIPLL